MQTIKYPQKKEWQKICLRPLIDIEELNDIVKGVFDDVKAEGDIAIRQYTEKFDKVNLPEFLVSEDVLANAENQISDDLKSAIILAKENIEKFHSSQKDDVKIIETSKGVKCWRESRPIENVGIYVPGGTAPLLSTVLMLGVPAKIAGCKEIILCSPPDKNGNIHPAILYTANLIGIKKVFAVGGIQAIAGLTFGTESIPKVDKIFGPGNQYVTSAKQLAQNYGVAIDMPAGPSEVLVIADKTANPEFVAADLLSQAEHGTDSQVVLVSNDESVINDSLKEVAKQVAVLPRREIAEKCLENSTALLFENIDECIDFSNLYAPEHLIIAVENVDSYLAKIIKAGSVFIGNYSCESAGDYASGTNHTLPTNGYARNYSGVSLDSFINKITFQKLSAEGIKNIGTAVEFMAEAEELFAHKNAVTVRLKSL
jgi:histidinol dehydrogenase